MDSLYSLRNETFGHICLPHSVDNHVNSIIVEGKSKLEDYIKYREDRDKAIVACFPESMASHSLDNLYELIYGERGL